MKLGVFIIVAELGASAAWAQGLDLNHAHRAELAADAALRSGPQAGQAERDAGNSMAISDGKGNSLRVGGVVQTRWVGNFRDVPGESNNLTEGFSVRRARLDFGGTIFDPRLAYDLRLEANRTSGDFLPLEVQFRYNLSQEWYVRAGQFKPPLNREEILGTTVQLAVDRSAAVAAFAQGYTQGAELGYQGQDVRLFATVSDGLGAVSSDFDSRREADYAFTGRAEYKLAGANWRWTNDFTSFRGSELGVLVGVAGHWQAGGDTNATPDIDFFQGGVDAQVEGDGWNFFAAVIWRHTQRPGQENADDFGAVVQGGVFVSDQTELFARWDAIFPDSSRGDAFNAATFGANYYLSPQSQAVKLSSDFGYFFNASTAAGLAGTNTAIGLLPDAEGGQWLLRAQFQVIF